MIKKKSETGQGYKKKTKKNVNMMLDKIKGIIQRPDHIFSK